MVCLGPGGRGAILVYLFLPRDILFLFISRWFTCRRVMSPAKKPTNWRAIDRHLSACVIVDWLNRL